MASTFIFTNSPYEKSSIPLGSLVPNIRQPHQDGFPIRNADPGLVLKEAVDPDDSGLEGSTPSADPVLENTPEAADKQKETDDYLYYTKCLDKDFHGRMKVTSGSVFKATLTKLMSIGCANLSGGHLELSSSEAFMYELKLPNDLFRKLCDSKIVQKWLEASLIDRQTVHFVVGVRTMKDARLFQERDHEMHTKGEGGVQLEELVGAPPIAGDLTKIKVEAVHQKSDSGEKSAKTMGERIYAVCYRKVHVKAVKGSLKAHLGKNKWQPFSQVRGDARQTEEIVIADLVDVAPIDDALQEEFQTDTGNEVFIYLPEATSIVSEQEEDQGEKKEEEDEDKDDEDKTDSESEGDSD